MSDKSDKTDKGKDKTPPPAAGVAVPNLAKRGAKGFFRDVQREMRHVTWPNRRETNRLTGVVLAVCFMVILLLTALSLGFQTLLDVILRRG